MKKSNNIKDREVATKEVIEELLSYKGPLINITTQHTYIVGRSVEILSLVACLIKGLLRGGFNEDMLKQSFKLGKEYAKEESKGKKEAQIDDLLKDFLEELDNILESEEE